jgi:hypothetical protein
MNATRSASLGSEFDVSVIASRCHSAAQYGHGQNECPAPVGETISPRYTTAEVVRRDSDAAANWYRATRSRASGSAWVGPRFGTSSLGSDFHCGFHLITSVDLDDQQRITVGVEEPEPWGIGPTSSTVPARRRVRPRRRRCSTASPHPRIVCRTTADDPLPPREAREAAYADAQVPAQRLSRSLPPSTGR